MQHYFTINNIYKAIRLYLVMVTSLFCSCQREPCSPVADTSIGIVFRRANGTIASDTLASAQGVGNNNAYTLRIGRAGQYLFALNPGTDSTLYSINFRGVAAPETLVIKYNRASRLVSESCGMVFTAQNIALQKPVNISDTVSTLATVADTGQNTHFTIWLR